MADCNYELQVMNYYFAKLFSNLILFFMKPKKHFDRSVISKRLKRICDAMYDLS